MGNLRDKYTDEEWDDLGRKIKEENSAKKMTGRCCKCGKPIRSCQCKSIDQPLTNKCFNKYCKNTADKATGFCNNCISPHDDIEKALGEITIENEKLWDRIVYYRQHGLNYEADAREIHFHAVRGTVAELRRKLLKND